MVIAGRRIDDDRLIGGEIRPGRDWPDRQSRWDSRGSQRSSSEGRHLEALSPVTNDTSPSLYQTLGLAAQSRDLKRNLNRIGRKET